MHVAHHKLQLIFENVLVYRAGEADATIWGKSSLLRNTRKIHALRNIDDPKEIQCDRALQRELISLDRRISAIERSIVFRALRELGLFTALARRQAGRLLLGSPLHRFYTKMGANVIEQNQYAAWFEQHRTSDPLAFRHIPPEQAPISFSVILPTKSPDPEWLRVAVESVRNQTWPNWELCVSADGDLTPPVRGWLDQLASEDRRIVLVSGDASGISATLNRGLHASTGDYVGFLDHDDLLEPTALAHVAETLSTNAFDLVYTDEDYVDTEGKPLRPNFKPGWSPALLHTCMYMGHFIVARRDLVLLAGGFDRATDGSQDFDLVLKLTDSGARVGHVARVLYHWRCHDGSTAKSAAAKPQTRPAGKKALEASIQRRRIVAEVTDDGRPNIYRVRLCARRQDFSLIIPSRNPALLRKCLNAIRERIPGTENLQLVIVHHQSEPATNAAMQAIAQEHRATVVPFCGPFHFARMMNEGARSAAGEVLVFLNDDIEPLTRDWLFDLTSPLGISGVAVTGARLLYPNRSIQHAGIVLGMGDGTGHCGRFLYDSSWWHWINYTRDVSAVTGACLATTAVVFKSLGGFDERFPNNYNDVDYCLRVRSSGLRVVIRNDSVLIHHEGMSRSSGTGLTERLAFFSRWAHLLDTPDAFFTPHLRMDREDLFPDLEQ